MYSAWTCVDLTRKEADIFISCISLGILNDVINLESQTKVAGKIVKLNSSSFKCSKKDF